ERLKVAVTLVAALIVTVHVPAPPHPPPLQPANVEPLAGAAVSVTEVPGAYDWSQSVPQLMPAGIDVTVPVPLPLRLTTSELLSAKGASTVTGAVTVRLHGAVPVQPAPDQPRK